MVIEMLNRFRRPMWLVALLCFAAAIIAAALLLDSGEISQVTGNKAYDIGSDSQAYDEDRSRADYRPASKAQADFGEGKGVEPVVERNSFASATNALEAHQIIEEAESKNIEYARDWEFKLTNFCAAAQQPPDMISQKQWLLERMKNFCEGYTVSSTESANSIENLMGLKEREYEREFLDSLSSADIDRQSELITKAIVSARFPEEISAISHLLAEFSQSEGLMPWDPLGDDHFEVGYFEAQQFALQYFKCMRFRSCGRNSIWFVEMCAYFEPCTEGWTFEDILVSSVTPVQREMGMRIVGHLFERLSEKR